MNDDQHNNELDMRQQQLPSSGPAYLNNLGQSLLDACRNGFVGQVQHLISYGAPYVEDWLGNSALHFAAMNGHLETCQYLLNAGIKRDVRTKVDRTPLHLAAQEGHHDVVELLLKSGADRDAYDGLRMTALHWASENCHVPVIQMLINYGANLQLSDKFGRTPLLICANKDHVESCQAICRAIYGDTGTEVVLSHSGETEAINLLTTTRRTSAFQTVRPAGAASNAAADEQLLGPQTSVAAVCNSSSGGSAAESEPEGAIFAPASNNSGLTLPLVKMNGVNGNVGLSNGDSPVKMPPIPTALDDDGEDDEDEEDMGRWPVCMEDENEVRCAARNVLEQLDRLHADMEESEVKVDGLPTDGGVSWLLNFLEMEGLSTEWVNRADGLLKGKFVSKGRVIHCKIRIGEQHLIFKVALDRELAFKGEIS